MAVYCVRSAEHRAGPLGLGFEGVLLATVICRVVALSFDPQVVFRHVFSEKPWAYYGKYLLRLLLALGTGGFIRLICSPLPVDTFWAFLVRAAVCLVIPNTLWFLIFRKTEAFALLLRRGKTFLTRLLEKWKGKRNTEAAV